MRDAGDRGSEAGSESERDGNEAEREPLWERHVIESGAVRDGTEAGAGPIQGRAGAAEGPEEGAFWDEDDDEELKSVMEAFYEFMRDTQELADAAADVAPRPRAPTAGAAGSKPRRRASVPKGRRRLRRWGEAARRAAMEEVASGGQRERRSLRAVREAFPLSQRELADRTRLSRATISEVEQGKRRPQPRSMRAIAQVLKVEVGEIRWE